jgi:hypothetical protein
MPLSMQLVSPGVQIAAWQLLAWQYCPVGQSVEATQRTHEPLVGSHSRPSGVQVRSEAHFVRQVSATQVLVVSAQSASERQSTQRPAVASQTWALEQSSEFVHGVNGTQVRAVQSLLAGQSAAVTQITHWAIEGSQTFPSGHWRLFWQPPGVPPSGLPLPPLLPQAKGAPTTNNSKKNPFRKIVPSARPKVDPS